MDPHRYGAAVRKIRVRIYMPLAGMSARLLLLNHTLSVHGEKVLRWNHGLVWGDEKVWIRIVCRPEINIVGNEFGEVHRISGRVKESNV